MTTHGHHVLLRLSLAALAALLVGAFALSIRPAPLTANQHIRQLVAFNPNQFPEGLSVAPDGTVIVGIISTGEIVRVTPNGTASRLAQVPLPAGGLLIGVLALDSTNVYALVQTNDDKTGVWLISQHGLSVKQIAKLPVGSLPNDLIADAQGRLYVTDTIGGRVFRVQPTGAVETWAAHSLLLGNVASPGPLGFPLGANGIAMAPSRDAVYVAVSEKARIVRIPIRPDGSAGPVTVVAENRALDGADGIDVGPNGVIYASVNGQNQIVAVDPATGSVDVVASGPIFHFPAVLRFSPDFKRLYVTNFDGLVLFGLAPGPARTGLLAIDVAGLAPQPLAVAPRPAIVPPSTGTAGLAQHSPARSGTVEVALVLAVILAGGAFARQHRQDRK